jgi:hypothetical protein
MLLCYSSDEEVPSSTPQAKKEGSAVFSPPPPIKAAKKELRVPFNAAGANAFPPCFSSLVTETTKSRYEVFRILPDQPIVPDLESYQQFRCLVYHNSEKFLTMMKTALDGSNVVQQCTLCVSKNLSGHIKLYDHAKIKGSAGFKMKVFYFYQAYFRAFYL